MNLKKQFMEGLLTQNPVLVQVLGMCSTMAITTSFFNGLGMGLAVTVILTLSNVIISAIRKIVPDKIRIAMFIVVIAGFVTFVMGLASAVCFFVNKFILIPLDLVYMQTVAFILVIAALVQFIEMFLQKSMPSLYTALGVYLPLITTNCAVLGVVLLNVQGGSNFIASVVYGITGGLGFLLAIVLFASIRERLVFADYPKSFDGFPIALVTAGLMALAFMGFSGLKIW